MPLLQATIISTNPYLCRPTSAKKDERNIPGYSGENVLVGSSNSMEFPKIMGTHVINENKKSNK